MCWTYHTRTKKPLLNYQSAHSKIGKNGIVKSCIKASLTKSCVHTMEKSVSEQVKRLEEAGDPTSVVRMEAQKLLK